MLSPSSSTNSKSEIIGVRTSGATPKASSESLWNAAGTWEERDYSKWAKTQLRSTLEKVQYKFPSNQGSARVTAIRSIEGDASVVNIRGKRKLIYDFAIELTWSATVRELKTGIEGKFVIQEVTSDCVYDVSG